MNKYWTFVQDDRPIYIVKAGNKEGAKRVLELEVRRHWRWVVREATQPEAVTCKLSLDRGSQVYLCDFKNTPH